MLEIVNNPLVIGVGIGFFALGWIVAKLGARLGDGWPGSEDPRNHRIRQLEADNRVMERELEDLRGELNDQTMSWRTTQDKLLAAEEELAKADDDLTRTRTDLDSETRKTRELRQELTDRAADTIRAQVRLEEVETELHVTKAGAEAMASVYPYDEALEAETDRVKTISREAEEPAATQEPEQESASLEDDDGLSYDWAADTSEEALTKRSDS